jgi:hypothetical protein
MRSKQKINGQQYTIIWHVDDLKILHVDRKGCRRHYYTTQQQIRKESPLTTAHGKVLEYLGMTLDYLKKVK